MGAEERQDPVGQVADEVTCCPTLAGRRVVPGVFGDGADALGELGGDALVALGDVAHGHPTVLRPELIGAGLALLAEAVAR